MIRKTLLTVAAAAVAAGISANAANATYYTGNGLTPIWVTIEAHPGENRWQACRRRYQRDVYKVRGAGYPFVRCNIDHSRIND